MTFERCTCSTDFADITREISETDAFQGARHHAHCPQWFLQCNHNYIEDLDLCLFYERGGKVFYFLRYDHHLYLVDFERLRQASSVIKEASLNNPYRMPNIQDLFPPRDLSSPSIKGPHAPGTSIAKNVFAKFIMWLQGMSTGSRHLEGRPVVGLRTTEQYLQLCAIAYYYYIPSLWNWSMYEIAQLQGAGSHLGHKNSMGIVMFSQNAQRTVLPFTVGADDSCQSGCRYNPMSVEDHPVLQNRNELVKSFQGVKKCLGSKSITNSKVKKHRHAKFFVLRQQQYREAEMLRLCNSINNEDKENIRPSNSPPVEAEIHPLRDITENAVSSKRAFDFPPTPTDTEERETRRRIKNIQQEHVDGEAKMQGMARSTRSQIKKEKEMEQHAEPYSFEVQLIARSR